MLLTSSQVSVVISSAIVVIFTFLLFLSGYVMQQKSVQSLHTAIRPHAPIPRHKPPLPEPIPINPSKKSTRPFGRVRDGAKLQSHLSTQSQPYDWSKLAYAQLVRDHSEVCNALIFFADLNRLKSPVPRLLLFPRPWARDSDGDVLDPSLEFSKRLLRKASRRYRVILVPVDPIGSGADGSDTSHYSLTTVFSLTQYERVLSFPPPGLILNSTPLDSILAFSDASTIASYPALNSSTSALSSLLLMKPASSTFKSLSHIQAGNSLPDTDVFAHTFPSTSPLLEDMDTGLYSTTAEIRTAKKFNATAFLEDTAFVLFQDSEVPGPEYEVPYTDTVKRRPSDEDQGFLWEKMYSTYKDRRYNVCGLDLETWQPPAKAAKQESEGKTDL